MVDQGGFRCRIVVHAFLDDRSGSALKRACFLNRRQVNYRFPAGVIPAGDYYLKVGPT
jgi:hypothetical protein